MDQNRKKRKKCKFFFLLNVLLEISAIGGVVYCTLVSHCVLGNEVSGPVFIFLLFIFSAFIPDLFYLFLSRKLHTLGIDPLGVMFNYLMGVLCILVGISLILVMLLYCGHYTQFILVTAGAFSVCSGVFHLMNAFMCHKMLPKSERYYKRRRQRKSDKGEKADKKANKADKKAKKAEKKGDKKGTKKGEKKSEKRGEKKGTKSDKKADKVGDKKDTKKGLEKNAAKKPGK